MNELVINSYNTNKKLISLNNPKLKDSKQYISKMV